MAARSICVPARMVVLLLAGRGAASGPTVRTGNGTVVGTAHGAVDVFAGIRYARAPRFAAPVPVEVEGVVDATKFGPACLQWGLRERVIGAEECLTLNVFAPSKAGLGSKAPRAVMVFIHGGGLTSGAATTYDFKDIAAEGDVVVVSLQYRLSWAGWLAVPGSVRANNAGLLDQVAALAWVQAHVAAFGGDAARVTIFGQSAGGTSVLLLASAPPAAGLFARAIAQSPWWASSQIGGIAADVAATEIWGECWCDVVDCAAGADDVRRALVSANATKLTEACGLWVAVVPDGDAVPGPVMGALCDGGPDPFAAALDDPGFELLVGSNHDEYRYWLMGVGNRSATEAAAYDDLVGYVRGNILNAYLDLSVNRTAGWTEACAADAANDVVAAIADAYGTSPFLDAVDFTTDFWFTVPTALAASAGRGVGAKRARYLFENDVGAATTVPLKTMHCTDLPYVLGFEGFVWRYNTTDEDAVRDYFHHPTPHMEATKRFVQGLWVDFAKRGFHDRDGWPRAGKTGEPHAHLHATRRVESAAPVKTKAGFDVARALYCDTARIRAAYLGACEAGVPPAAFAP